MSNKKIEIKGFPLIKFQCIERIEQLQKGLVYMKSLDYYRQLEKESGDCVSGDLYEALLHINEAQLIVPEIGLNEYIKDGFLPTNYSNDFVFCMFRVNKTVQPFQFTDEQKKKLVNFGDTALLITDSHEFIRRVAIAAEKEKYKGFHCSVNYYDPHIDSLSLLISLVKNIGNIAFSKREIYQYQQEYRFLVHNEFNKDHIELKIGDISDISMIQKTSIILNSSVI